ncbi:hypothetical protein PAXINDRAFT_21962 [Paxillus involutus ATCC 200175]|uniref:Uncharacterized protein n=1 Tax=Paxillus involutus ATCC 200175 TaxID=664439 RepID=A0A0C9T001_PAXIN|nr:hypothetical protein PAXINDRAFT_21962 [Paxillus involutus ATCC 200175]
MNVIDYSLTLFYRPRFGVCDFYFIEIVLVVVEKTPKHPLVPPPLPHPTSPFLYALQKRLLLTVLLKANRRMTKHHRTSTNSVSESPALAVSFSSRGTDAMPANTYIFHGSRTEPSPPFFATTCPIPAQQLNSTVPGLSLPTHLTMHHVSLCPYDTLQQNLYPEPVP